MRAGRRVASTERGLGRLVFETLLYISQVEAATTRFREILKRDVQTKIRGTMLTAVLMGIVHDVWSRMDVEIRSKIEEVCSGFEQ